MPPAATSADAAAPPRGARKSNSTNTSPKSSTVAIDLAAGTAGGVCQLLVGHPFDCIKTKMQSQGAAVAAAKFAGPREALVSTLRDEGVRGVYRGMGAPLATVALFNAVLFASRGAATSALLARRREEGGGGGEEGAPLTAQEGVAVALAASAAVSVVATPTELLKCRLQAQGDPKLAAQRLAAQQVHSHAAASSAPLFRGPLDAARHVIQHERGGIGGRFSLPIPGSGLFKGLFATFSREALGNVAMFGVYDWARQGMAERRGVSIDRLPSSDVMLAGGVGGTAFWLASFPADLIKSKLQTEPYDAPKYRGFWDCAAKVVRTEGLRGLWRGFTPALLRSAPANAACFAGYEYAREFLQATG